MLWLSKRMRLVTSSIGITRWFWTTTCVSPSGWSWPPSSTNIPTTFNQCVRSTWSCMRNTVTGNTPSKLRPDPMRNYGLNATKRLSNHTWSSLVCDPLHVIFVLLIEQIKTFIIWMISSHTINHCHPNPGYDRCWYHYDQPDNQKCNHFVLEFCSCNK